MSAASSLQGINAQNGNLVTPSDTLPNKLIGFYLEQDSVIAFQFEGVNANGNTISGGVSFKAGYHPIRCIKVLATNTTLNGVMLGFT